MAFERKASNRLTSSLSPQDPPSASAARRSRLMSLRSEVLAGRTDRRSAAESLAAITKLARRSERLQPRGEIGRLADDRLFLRRALADQVADDHQPGGDPDARLQFGGSDIEATDCGDRAANPARTARSASSS